MKYEASVRKVRQLSREIEEHKPYHDLQHSAWKLLSFLAEDVPGWRDAMLEYDAEADDAE